MGNRLRNLNRAIAPAAVFTLALGLTACSSEDVHDASKSSKSAVSPNTKVKGEQAANLHALVDQTIMRICQQMGQKALSGSGPHAAAIVPWPGGEDIRQVSRDGRTELTAGNVTIRNKQVTDCYGVSLIQYPSRAVRNAANAQTGKITMPKDTVIVGLERFHASKKYNLPADGWKADIINDDHVSGYPESSDVQMFVADQAWSDVLSSKGHLSTEKSFEFVQSMDKIFESALTE